MIHHYPSMTTDTLVANLGGQLGLWIGASVVSLIQIIGYIILRTTDRCRRKGNSNATELAVQSPAAASMDVWTSNDQQDNKQNGDLISGEEMKEKSHLR